MRAAVVGWDQFTFTSAMAYRRRAQQKFGSGKTGRWSCATTKATFPKRSCTGSGLYQI